MGKELGVREVMGTGREIRNCVMDAGDEVDLMYVAVETLVEGLGPEEV